MPLHLIYFIFTGFAQDNHLLSEIFSSLGIHNIPILRNTEVYFSTLV